MISERVTGHPECNEQLLYFTSNSLLADDQRLVIISDRTGDVNLFVRDMATGDECQLTDNAEGFLKSYVYFEGRPYQGLGRASVSLDAQRGIVYYLQGREIRATDMAGNTHTLALTPAGQMTAFTHVSEDGTRLVVPTTDAYALDGEVQLAGKPEYDIDERVQMNGLSSYLHVYDTASGHEVACEAVPRSWITHVQFAPLDRHTILYNHEWPADCGVRRVWLWDGATHHMLRPENVAESRSREDWTCHEMWERDGSWVIYHGSYAGGSEYEDRIRPNSGRGYLGRVRPDGSGLREIAFPEGWTQYGHFTVGQPNWLVSDGYYRQGESAAHQGEWISLLHMDWEAGEIEWIPLEKSGSSWDSQDSHPHPIFDHAGRAVYFTSDREGKRAVYRIDVSQYID